MYSLALACLFSVALAAPQFQDNFQQFQPDNVEILEMRNNAAVGAVYDFGFRTADGTVKEERGEENFAGTADQIGEFSFVSDDGVTYTLSYVADSNGFQPRGAHIPAIPPHALEQLRKAEEERAAGITHDGFWDPIRYA